MDLIGGGQENRLGMPNSLGPPYNSNNNNPSSSSSIGEPAIPSKIPPITTTTTTTTSSVISTRRDLSSSTHNTGNGISVLDHHHHYQQQQIRQDSPDPPPQPPAQTQDPDRDPDPVSIAVVSAAIASISAPGSNPRTPKPTKNLSSTSIRYRECLKNHAASIGGHVVDGCGEFMPGGEVGPEALKCAACDCHRNFHRREVNGEPQHGANCFYCYNPNNKIDRSRTRPLPLPQPPQPLAPPLQHHHHHQKFSLGLPTSPTSGPIPQMMMAFGGGGTATDSSSEELNVFHSNAGGGTPVAPPQFSLSSKKRFRTKFTQEQKDKMLEFAEKVGWRVQKQDELAVQQFCAEVGVKRQVLKVWMHNNKHVMKKKDM